MSACHHPEHGKAFLPEQVVTQQLWQKFPAGHLVVSGEHEVLRLRICFASQSRYFAQDDTAYGGVDAYTLLFFSSSITLWINSFASVRLFMMIWMSMTGLPGQRWLWQ